jgi:hypothetical protein
MSFEWREITILLSHMCILRRVILWHEYLLEISSYTTIVYELNGLVGVFGVRLWKLGTSRLVIGWVAKKLLFRAP